MYQRLPFARQVALRRAVAGQSGASQRVTLDAAVFKQQFSQRPGAQTLQCAPWAFEPSGTGHTARPNRRPPFNGQDHFSDMAAAGANGLLFLRPQGLVTLPEHVNLDGAVLTQACRQGAGGG